MTFQRTNQLRRSWLSVLPYTGIAEGKRTDGDLSHGYLITSRVCTATSPGCEKPLRSSGPSVRLSRVTVSAAGEMAGILAWFWNERFWLPHNVTWADLKNTDEATFPQAEDLYLACPLAFCIFMIRLVFERWVWAHAIFQVAVMRFVVSIKYANDAAQPRCPCSPVCNLNNGILSG